MCLFIDFTECSDGRRCRMDEEYEAGMCRVYDFDDSDPLVCRPPCELDGCRSYLLEGVDCPVVICESAPSPPQSDALQFTPWIAAVTVVGVLLLLLSLAGWMWKNRRRWRSSENPEEIPLRDLRGQRGPAADDDGD